MGAQSDYANALSEEVETVADAFTGTGAPVRFRGQRVRFGQRSRRLAPVIIAVGAAALTSWLTFSDGADCPFCQPAFFEVREAFSFRGWGSLDARSTRGCGPGRLLTPRLLIAREYVFYPVGRY